MRLSNPSIRLIAAVMVLLWGAADATAQAKPSAPAKQPEKSAPASKSPVAAPTKTGAPQATAPAKTPAPSKAATKPAPTKSPVSAPASKTAAPAPAQKAQAPKAAAPAPKSAPATPKVKPQAPAPKAAPKGKAKGAQGEKPAEAAEESVSMRQGNRRDPFEYLVGRKDKGGGIPDRLPAGKAGLVIATMRLDGVVRHQAGMIAVVSNPQQRVYFLREGDRLYDGRVEKISMDGVMMRELSKDAFGKPLERVVTKRIYPSAGEQQ